VLLSDQINDMDAESPTGFDQLHDEMNQKPSMPFERGSVSRPAVRPFGHPFSQLNERNDFSVKATGFFV
jgi:hypothetical protein